jgi:hypothetical protein
MTTTVSFEPFVTAEIVADFLSASRREVLKLTRDGKLRAYPLSGRERHVWKYRLSEVAEDIAALEQPRKMDAKLVDGSPRSSAKKERERNG